MSASQLCLISANKSRPSGQAWSDDAYDVRDGSLAGPVVGRIYRMPYRPPSGLPWFWTLNIFPAVSADHGSTNTRESATEALKARWLERIPK